ncbi:hypothetical protein [Actinokineospora iranica]|uniref:Uncharacterized protein n=1 Tax=Actinokineospora iranica TaxID=1271860 RepID=A0A1G6UW37_9PSEU|nr:hypothetical protein [Actinokineospora iranica]SDD45538.1 hypothetical protein SAMN05216174_111118 [Actinokineospora iranica]
MENTPFGRKQIAPRELCVQAGRAAAAICFAAYDDVALTVLTGLGVPEPERLTGPAVTLVADMRLRRLATDTPGTNGRRGGDETAGQPCGAVNTGPAIAATARLTCGACVVSSSGTPWKTGTGTFRCCCGGVVGIS